MNTWAFILVVALGAMSPGPDFAVVVRHSVVSGRGHGMATAAGIAAGVFVWAAAAASGVAALIAWAPGALTALKLVGAGYLLYLGVRSLRSGGQAAAVEPGARKSKRAAFRDGLLCNVLNPKAAVFFVALLPQFLPAEPGIADTVVLSGLAVAVTIVWFTSVAALVSALRRLLDRAPVRRAIDRVTGVVLIGLGVRLAVTSAR
ncbi:lysine transporter LysE [Paractinoplanes abujensis]|uniref:Threonine/homoserine/homoserine lactone efflux protein n=1 Tax=Paractinoplanes abujensis TaxID=882441 RepID=A0A7W7CN61_9ACTN|nr:LysE family translocator [Actinoplanes abujensis]MBB4691622.1 threonine/homoserine/homoserine lactone efflux protein [Actinoplanes abujensis]GID16959.1 lysine transporter LysE [Actinoplanes abujensis]